LDEGFDDETFPQGVFAKQDCPPSHSALDPLGHGLASAQLSARALQLDPQKYLDAISSISVSALLFVSALGLSPITGRPAGDVALPLLADDGLFPLQGVPLKHDMFFFGHSANNI